MLNFEFFFLLIIPWFADLLGGRFVMLSIVGLTLWAVSLTFHFLSFKTLDKSYRNILRNCSRMAIVLWAFY